MSSAVVFGSPVVVPPPVPSVVVPPVSALVGSLRPDVGLEPPLVELPP